VPEFRLGTMTIRKRTSNKKGTSNSATTACCAPNKNRQSHETSFTWQQWNDTIPAMQTPGIFITFGS
jgi:hypothetical protein